MDVIGKRFGRLTVLSEAPRKGYVVCQCDCGNICQIWVYNLTKRQHPTISCGCRRREVSHVNGKTSIRQNSAGRLERMARYGTNVGLIANHNPPRNNKSGYKGVFYDESRGTYIARISFRKQAYYLGSYHKFDEAVAARQEAEERFFAPVLAEAEAE